MTQELHFFAFGVKLAGRRHFLLRRRRCLLADCSASFHDLIAQELHFFAFEVDFAGRRHFLLLLPPPLLLLPLHHLLADCSESLHDLIAPDLHFFAFGVGFAGRRHFLLHFLLLLLLLHNRQSILQPHVAVAQQQQFAAQVFLEP